LTLLDDNLFVTYIIIIRPGIRRLLPDFLSLSGAQFRADDKNIVPLPCLFPRAFPPRKIPLSRSPFPGARPRGPAGKKDGHTDSPGSAVRAIRKSLIFTKMYFTSNISLPWRAVTVNKFQSLERFFRRIFK